MLLKMILTQQSIYIFDPNPNPNTLNILQLYKYFLQIFLNAGVQGSHHLAENLLGCHGKYNFF